MEHVTDSHETYQNAARQQYHLLMANYREGNHEIVIGYLKEFSIHELLDQFSLIKEYLKREGIIAYHVVEITRDKFGNPVNRIHYHFLIRWMSVMSNKGRLHCRATARWSAAYLAKKRIPG